MVENVNTALRMLKGKLKEKNYKLIKIGSARWANEITKQIEQVDNIWILGWKGSDRPLLITGFDIIQDGEIHNYVLTTGYAHCNIASFKTDIEIDFEDSKVTMYGQEFCNPMTANHIWEGKEKDLVPLIKATLLSQNFDDAYSAITSVRNGYIDKVVTDSENEQWLTPETCSPIELLLGKSSLSLRNLDGNDFNKELRNLTSIKVDEIYVKKLGLNCYCCYSQEYYTKYKNDFSSYYPVYDYNFIKDLNIEIPRDFYDLGVYGLGSAGTAILDCICRGNWFKNIYLCDNDIVEPKNMINQWYEDDDVGLSKVTASERRIKHLNRDMPFGISTHFTVRKDNSKFQDTELTNKMFKYVVSGFDTIETRQEFLEKILAGDIIADYLIDCRYLDLACSIYFIDLHNEEQLNFYKANLDADGDLIRKKIESSKMTKEEFVDWVKRKGYFMYDCYMLKHDINAGSCNQSSMCCGESECAQFLYDAYVKSLPNPKINPQGTSCVKYNYIDIYKYVGAIVFGAIRSIENETGKPFTAIEAQTGSIPNYMVVKE